MVTVLITALLRLFNQGVLSFKDKAEMQNCESHFYVFIAGCEGVVDQV